MTEPAQESERLREIVREHAAIRAIVGRIERRLDRPCAAPRGPAERPELPELLRSLEGHLVRHFRLEESGGLLGGASSYYAPSAQAEAAELIAEHRRFEHRVTRLRDELTSLHDRADVAWNRSCGALRRLLDELVRHEAREERLLERITAPGRRSAG